MVQGANGPGALKRSPRVELFFCLEVSRVLSLGTGTASYSGIQLFDPRARSLSPLVIWSLANSRVVHHPAGGTV